MNRNEEGRNLRLWLTKIRVAEVSMGAVIVTELALNVLNDRLADARSGDPAEVTIAAAELPKVAKWRKQALEAFAFLSVVREGRDNGFPVKGGEKQGAWAAIAREARDGAYRLLDEWANRFDPISHDARCFRRREAQLAGITLL